MPKLTKNRRGTSKKRTTKSSAPTKEQRARRKTPPATATKRGAGRPAVEQPSPEEEAAFTEALIQSGEAAPLDREGKLPAGATHKIVEDDEGNLKVVRRRFSIT